MDAVQFLHDLVAIRSLSGQEQEAASFLVRSMNEFGFENTRVDEAGNAIGERSNPDSSGLITQTIVLLGHMDTVPGEIPVRIDGGVLHGRGSVDAKGPLAAFVVATAQAKLPAGVRVVIVGATEEESATSRGARHIASQLQPDICIIGEPSSWDGVTLGYKGRLLIDYVAHKPMGHTAGPETGVAEVGLLWLSRVNDYIDKFNQQRTRLFDQLLPSVRAVNTLSDGLYDEIKIKIGVRLPPDFDADDFEKSLRGLFPDDAMAKQTITCFGYEAAWQSKRTCSIAKTFNRVFLGQGIRPRFKTKTGTSDMNVVGPVWKCPIVAYGPGDSNLDHTPNEHLVLDEYAKAIAILKSVLEFESA